MKSLVGQFVRNSLLIAVMFLTVATGAQAAPYAAHVMDARTGETLYASNADTRLHPASLTKMLTLYIAFSAIQRGEITLDTMVTVSRNAASKPPSRLGLRAGQKIALRYLIRAAAVKSANDAASAIGDALGGDEESFAQIMNRTAKSLGMSNSSFRNANGLTASGHLSTARDMSTLGRRLFFDFPQYYNIFSRRSTDAGMAEVANTNRRFLDAYEGADGIKTGYTNAAGFNLTASAVRGNKRIIATVFGGTSTAQRNSKMKELLDIGFNEAPRNAPIVRPDAPAAVASIPMASAPAETGGGSGMAVASSLRPRLRPGSPAPAAVAQIESAVAVAAAAPPVPPPVSPGAIQVAVAAAAAAPIPFEVIQERVAEPETPEVVTRMSTSGGRHWGVNVGRYNSRGAADRALMQIALSESASLEDGLRKIVERGGAYDANFMGLSQDQADLACRRLRARSMECFPIGP
uniref:D-alanyl-D-alanine carboxypeptidase family protein n=1 Tax=Falsirhodobacter xinxiangensis TaxID=2530049 RepID=UPI00145BBEE5|nr:D-alanyl-D-alanine carboxypeptidase family protein [Rhodobacter xinxiangensis]